MIVTLKNETGLTRQVKVGFSWTSFFFGPFPFFFRGMSGSGVIWLLLALMTLGLSTIYLWFTINKKTAHHYMEIGYHPIGEGWDEASLKWGVSLSNKTEHQVPIQLVAPPQNGEDNQGSVDKPTTQVA